MFGSGTRRGWVVVLALIAFATGASAPASAEDPPEPKPPAGAEQTARRPRPGDVQKVFIIENVSPRALAEVLKVFPATFTYQGSKSSMPREALGVSAAPAVMAAIEETIKRLDVPRATPSGRGEVHRSVEITGYVLDAVGEAAGPSGVPSDLEPVIAQLKRTFGYAGYRLVDTLIARAAEGSSVETNALGAAEGAAPARRSYRMLVNRVTVTPAEGGPTVFLRNLEFYAQIPVPTGDPGSITVGPGLPAARGFRYQDVGVKANVELRPGQKAVVGKSGVADPSKAMFLVLSANVEEYGGPAIR